MYVTDVICNSRVVLREEKHQRQEFPSLLLFFSHEYHHVFLRTRGCHCKHMCLCVCVCRKTRLFRTDLFCQKDPRHLRMIRLEEEGVVLAWLDSLTGIGLCPKNLSFLSPFSCDIEHLFVAFQAQCILPVSSLKRRFPH